MFLVAGKIVEMEDVAMLFSSLGKYIACCMVGHAIHGILVLPAIYAVITRKNPYTFLWGIFTALATAFGTSSRYDQSAAAMSSLHFVNIFSPNLTCLYLLLQNI